MFFLNVIGNNFVCIYSLIYTIILLLQFDELNELIFLFYLLLNFELEWL